MNTSLKLLSLMCSILFLANSSYGIDATVLSSKTTLTISGLTSSNKTYDGTITAIVSGTAELVGVVGEDDVVLSGNPVFQMATSVAGNNIPIQITGYTISGADADKYELVLPTLSADILRAPIWVMDLFGENKTYDGTQNATVSGTPLLLGIIGSDNVTLSGTPTFTFKSKNVGNAIEISANGYSLSGSDHQNYELKEPAIFADISPAPLTIKGLTGMDKVFDGTPIATVSGTASLYGVLGNDQVMLAGNPFYIFEDSNIGTNKTIYVEGYIVVGVDAGNYYLILPTLSGDITPLQMILTVSGLTGIDKKYDGTTAATVTGSPALIGVNVGDDVTLTGTPDYTFASKNVGNEIAVIVSGLSLTGSDAGKYSLIQPVLSASILHAKLDIIGLSGDDKIYDGATAGTASGVATLSGVFGNDNVSIAGSPIYTFASKNVGTNVTINVSGYALSGVDAGNYNLTQPTLSADIDPASLTVVGLVGDDKIYDGTTAATASGTPSLSGVIGADDVSLSGSPVYTFGQSQVGQNISISTMGFSLSGADTANYNLIQPTLTADITPVKKELTIIGLSGNDKIYDGSTAGTATGVATLSGVEGNDNVSIAGAPIYTFVSKDVGTEVVINVSGFTLSGTDAGNYYLTQPTLSADIDPASLMVVGLTGDDKTYDGTTRATASGTPFLSGVIGVDDVSLSGIPVYTFSQSQVGQGISISTMGFSLTGSDASNYRLIQPTLTADITPAKKELTIVGLSGNSKIYDGSTAGTATGVATLSGVVGNDAVAIIGAPVYTFVSKDVGTNVVIHVSGFSLSGADAGSYYLTQPTLSADIDPAQLSIVGLTGNDKYYDGTTAATASGTPSLSGIIGIDDVSLSGSPIYTFDRADIGTDVKITTKGFTLSGIDTGNYSLIQPTLYADIRLNTGVTSKGDMRMSIFPNPASEYVLVEGMPNKMSYEVYSLSGEMIMNGNLNENEMININGLKSGGYILKLENQATLIFYKL